MTCCKTTATLEKTGYCLVKGKNGYTLVETMISMLLVATIVTSVFSMVLTAKVGSVKSGNQGKAHLFARQQAEKLKAYISADLAAPGPRGTALPSPDNWKFPGDTSGNYALAPGVHNVTGNLPGSLVTLGWTMTYNVTTVACGAKTCQKVDFTVGWPGP